MDFKKLALATMVAGALAGCNSSNDNSSGGGNADKPNPPPGDGVSVGAFYDAPTNGLYYVTSSGLTGYTGTSVINPMEDEESEKTIHGSFRYREGDLIEFRLGGPGGLLIGEGEAQQFVMPQDAASPELALNAARLLLTIDNNRDDREIIEIPEHFKNLSTDQANQLRKIDLGGFDEAVVSEILAGIVGGFSEQEIIKTDYAEKHLTNTSGEVARGRSASDPEGSRFDMRHKIMRSEIRRVSSDGELCFMDISRGNDAQKEFDKRVGYSVFQHSVEKDGELGAEGEILDGFNGCDIDETKFEDGFFSYANDFGWTEEDLVREAGQLNGLTRNPRHKDITRNTDGSIKVATDDEGNDIKVIANNGKELPLAKGALQDRRHSYSYSSTSGVMYDTQTRFPLEPGKQGYEAIEDGGEEYALRINSRDSEWLEISYEVNSINAPAPMVDFTGSWAVDKAYNSECNAFEKELWVFDPRGFTIKEVTYGDDCNQIVTQVEPDEEIEDFCDEDNWCSLEYWANKDFWFFAANNNKPEATLMQLNMPVKWDEGDGYGEEFVRWSYMPQGENLNNGILYRYKYDVCEPRSDLDFDPECVDGLSHVVTEVYTRWEQQ